MTMDAATKSCEGAPGATITEGALFVCAGNKSFPAECDLKAADGGVSVALRVEGTCE